MKNLKIRKKMFSLALFNMILLISKPNIAYAKTDSNSILEETKDIIDFVKATEDIVIKDEPSKIGEIVGTLRKGETLKFLTRIDGFYEVLYNGEIAYVRDDKVIEVENDSTYGYITKDSPLYVTEYKNTTYGDINKYQLVDILKVCDNSYLVEVNGKAGYIDKDNIERLYGKFIVVDISEQNVKMYNNNEIIINAPVVTGQPPHNSTPLGAYRITYIGDHYKLKGRYYVDHMMAFNGNIGLHDAEYHTNEAGYSYGWRDTSEFCKSTYLTDGSHGCINMLNRTSQQMRENIEMGIRVLVKE